MCGIFGYYGLSSDNLSRARKALNTLEHRGPNQWGDWYNSNVYIGHQRLSIIDLSEKATQPMQDENSVIAHNGEIYNFLDIRSKLERKYNFKSSSDSEVLLHGYNEWGLEKLLDVIDGMYVFSIYDKKLNKLFLVRDRFGQKPLFYTSYDQKLLFSSEIKALFEFAPSLRVFSYEGIKDWIYHRGSHHSETIYYNIHKLQPGCYLEITKSGIKINKYYDILDYINEGDYQDHGFDNLEKDLSEAVNKRLISDVPLGVMLSGGIDSSLIAYYLNKKTSAEKHTFSIGFDKLKYRNYTEESYARHVASKFGFTHHHLNISSDDVMDSFEKVIYHCDGMLDFPNTIAIYLLSKYAKDFVTVILTGEGADELFGGYNKYNTAIKQSINNSPQLLNNLGYFFLNKINIRRLTSTTRELYLKKEYMGENKKLLEDINCYISPETFSKIFGENTISIFDNIDYNQLLNIPFYKQLLIMDHKTYLFSVLDRQDRATMAASLESRSPFLDKNLIENSISLSKRYFFNDNQTKVALKNKSEEIFGKEFTYRKKMGFPLPINNWINTNKFSKYLNPIFSTDFLLNKKIDTKFLHPYLKSNSFDYKLVNYANSERLWINWFLMVLRTAQDVFNIKEIN